MDLNLRVTGVSAAGDSAVSRDAELPLWILRVVPAFSFTAVIPWPIAEEYFRLYIWFENLLLTVLSILHEL